MKILFSILEALVSLFVKRRPKAIAPSSEYKKLGTTTEGEEWGTTANLSDEDLEYARQQFEIDQEDPVEKNKIICNGEEVDIDWDSVSIWTEPNALVCKSNQYRKRVSQRAVSKVVVHWDGCLSSKQCASVLKERGLSAHFCIDNDGTIHQLMDANHIAWHAKGVNSTSIGIEISNAVYMKYAKKYKPLRPLAAASELHGKEFPEHLDFYDVQVQALKALLKSLCEFYNVPLECPNQDGTLIRGVIPTTRYKGVLCHYHVTDNKSDPACLDLVKVIEEIKDEL